MHCEYTKVFYIQIYNNVSQVNIYDKSIEFYSKNHTIIISY